ncbi:carboxyltransferase domain-containing protein [Rothia sp. HC945]|uniref:5-oxoprolinase subunit B/C family protein n=1 Tax=Rothia sp. HC945 TaxID=3171170 RepID=UPI003F22E073
MPDQQPRRIHPTGRSALLVDCDGIEDVLSLHTALSEDPLRGQLELIPAASTLLVRFRCPLSPAEERACTRRLSSMRGKEGLSAGASVVEIPVEYSGEDLDDVAQHVGASVEEVVRRHSETTWRAAFSGFSPGFAYLVAAEGEAPLTVPRRSSPRTRVPAGSVGLAGEFSAVYPSASPGGWQLIGTTDADVWDLERDVPALITPGTTVRFCPRRKSVTVRDKADASRGIGPGDDHHSTGNPVAALTEENDGASDALRIDSPGLATLIQDRGRQGHTGWGVSPSGWADPAAAESANRLVGNDLSEPVLENTAGQLSVTALRDVVLAVTGAEGDLRIRDSGTADRVPGNRPFALLAGQRLTIGSPDRGLRFCLAVRGGIRTSPVLGSSATDTLASLGPKPLAKNDVVRCGPQPRRSVGSPVSGADLPLGREVTDIRISPGPRLDWFTSASVRKLTETTWSVTEASNRVGARLARWSSDQATDELPSPLERTAEAQGRELPSEGIVEGAVQVPPSGNPVIFMADHPVTGGYPVIGVVEPDHLRLLAQAPPGSLIRLVLDAS